MDSAGEIASALNTTLSEMGMPSLPLARVEALIGKGVRVLVERALAEAADPAQVSDIDDTVDRFESHYAKVVGTHAQLYAGVLPGLELLHAAAVPMAVVTNKPRAFTVELLERLHVRRFFSPIVAGDDGHRRKPEGDMLLAACAHFGLPPAQVLMLGDSDNDVRAARAARCPAWCVPYGYNEGRPVETLSCDRIVPTVEAAARIVRAGLHP